MPSYSSSDSLPTIPCYDGDHGLPRLCFCGGPVPIHHINGRLRFICPEYDGGEEHIGKWFDVAVIEEFEEIRRGLGEQLERQGELAASIGWCKANDIGSTVDSINSNYHNLEEMIKNLEYGLRKVEEKNRKLRKLSVLFGISVVLLIFIKSLV